MVEQREPNTLRELLADLNAQGITDYRRYERVKQFLNFKAREKGVPISGSFELTPLCNLDCKMCYVHLNKEQMKGAQLLSVEQWKDIMQQAIDAGMLYATLTGGECLTYPGFKELYLFLRMRGVEVDILSNGILMNDEMVGFLRENLPARVQITLYGASDEGYERVTGYRAFETVTKNMYRLKTNNIPLRIAVTPNAYMMDGEDILHWLHKKNFPYQINAGLMPPREETGRVTRDAPIDVYVSLLKLRMTQFGKAVEPCPDPEGLPEPGGKTCSVQYGVTCGAGRSGFSVDWQGGMRPCNTFPCEAQNVMNLGFGEAWKRTQKTAMNIVKPVECENCAYKETCKHCVSEHAAGAPLGHASPAVCAWRKRMAIDGLLKQS